MNYFACSWAVALLQFLMPAFPSVVERHKMNGDAAAAATQISVKLITQLPEPFKVPEDALVTLSGSTPAVIRASYTNLSWFARVSDCSSQFDKAWPVSSSQLTAGAK